MYTTYVWNSNIVKERRKKEARILVLFSALLPTQSQHHEDFIRLNVLPVVHVGKTRCMAHLQGGHS
jgi:hypothetical protein